MALDNYDNLKNAIQRWTHRQDITQDLLDDFIDLCESEMYSNEAQPLRVTEMETRTELTAPTASRFLALPARFLSFRRLDVELSGGDTEIEYRAPSQMLLGASSGVPQFFTVTDQIEFDRTPDSAYTLPAVYFAKNTPLDSTNTTNNILTNYPSIYLHGCLWACYEWAREEDVASYHYNKFINAIRGANKTTKRKANPAPIIRAKGIRP